MHVKTYEPQVEIVVTEKTATKICAAIFFFNWNKHPDIQDLYEALRDKLQDDAEAHISDQYEIILEGEDE